MALRDEALSGDTSVDDKYLQNATSTKHSLLEKNEKNLIRIRNNMLENYDKTIRPNYGGSLKYTSNCFQNKTIKMFSIFAVILV